MKFLVKFFLLINLALMSSVFANAQKYSVYGKVVVSGRNLPIEGIYIRLTPGKYEGITNTNGLYQIKNVNKGEYLLIISSIGYKTISQKVKVDSSDVQLDFSLVIGVTELNGVTVIADDVNSFGISRLNAVEGTSIYAGKKTEVIRMEDVSANLATNSARQIYSKIPGLNIWESDGAGIQLGIGGRGLSPNRTSNFNTRQNGYDISADALGYPESYYTPPAEAIERIEIVRGAASLQYGTQFGGMINFKLKRGIETKKFQLVSRQTLGSFGFYNVFNSVGGTHKKFNYYAFHQFKRGDGWRTNSKFNAHTTHGVVTYHPTKRLSISAEYTFMHYLAQQPGGLTDKLFEKDPRQSIRNRNWFQVNWNLAALVFNYKFNERTTLDVRNFGLLAQRDALGFLGSINRSDPMQERDLLRDKFRNFGNETRFIHRYTILRKNAVFLVGERYYRGFTQRWQGDGYKSDGPDFDYIHPTDVEDSYFDFPSQNLSLFCENIFYLSPKISITPGIRYEHINTKAKGFYKESFTDLAGNIIFSQKVEEYKSNTRSFALMGIGVSNKLTKNIELYGNISQNYRAINFNDMRIANLNLQVNPNLKDESGFSTDIGVRGNLKQIFNYDVSLFLINYNDRIGSVLRVDSTLYNIYRYRTNISDSRNYGLESFLELDVWRVLAGKETKNSLSVFANIALLDARYINSDEAAYENKKVELVPDIFVRTGVTYKRKNIKANFQYAYTGEQFTDATNARLTSNAVNGIIPAYHVMDLSFDYTHNRCTLGAGINNLSNNLYFTRRADGYPGPGIIPSDGRSLYINFQIRI